MSLLLPPRRGWLIAGILLGAYLTIALGMQA